MTNTNNDYTDFVSTLSHELRTPLTSIRGFADTLLVSGDKLSDEQKRKFLEIIKDQSGRLIKMVENLLALSKLNSENSVFVYKATNVVPIIEQVFQLVKRQYAQHKFKIELPQSLHSVPAIYVDTDKFQQILVNLVENAAKYSNEGSFIIVKIQIKSNMLSISVTDEGAGIEDKDLKKIFEKFVRVDSPLTRKTQGSGLGLYITKNLVEKMKGIIQVTSSEKGSTFEVLFPIVTPEMQAQQKLKENNNAG